MENETMDCTENKATNASTEKQDSEPMCLDKPPTCMENAFSEMFDKTLEQAVTSIEPTNNIETNTTTLPPQSAHILSVNKNPFQEEFGGLMDITEDVTVLHETICENYEESQGVCPEELTSTVASQNQNTSQMPEFIGPVIPEHLITSKELTNSLAIHEHQKAVLDITPQITRDTSQRFIETTNNDSFFQRSNFAKKEAPHLFSHSTIIELSTSSWSPIKSNIQPYLRGCKWSPDGSSCLCVVNNDGVHVVNLPDFSGPICTDRAIDILRSAVHVREAGLVYDFCWYPSKNDSPPQCWATTLQNAPLQLWNACDGSLLATYRGFNAVDEMEPAISVIFEPQGSQIIGGYRKNFKVFDINRPGRDCTDYKLNGSASCMAFDNSLLAVGSWNRTLSLYSFNHWGCNPIAVLHGHKGGLTHMKFTPDGTKLVTGARKDDKLIVWDVRYTNRELNELTRTVDTNQRIYFDISNCGRYLISGGTDGLVQVWDAFNGDWSSDSGAAEKCESIYKFPVHTDCCNSISIHPKLTILATGSGQYHANDPIDSDNSDEARLSPTGEKKNKPENSLVFWWTGPVKDMA